VIEKSCNDKGKRRTLLLHDLFVLYRDDIFLNMLHSLQLSFVKWTTRREEEIFTSLLFCRNLWLLC